MRFDLRSHESLVLVLGMLGLVEQEAVRLLTTLEPSNVLSGIFGSMVLGSIGIGAYRGSKAELEEQETEDHGRETGGERP